MNRFASIGLVALGFASACGGKGGGASAPSGGATCAAAAAAIVRGVGDEVLADMVSAEQRPAADARLTAGFAEACAEGAWTVAQRACFVDAGTFDAVRECTGTFEGRQTELYGAKMLAALKDIDPDPAGAE